MAAPGEGAAVACIKHDDMQGRKLCTHVAKSWIVDKPYFSQLFQRPKRRRMAASASAHNLMSIITRRLPHEKKHKVFQHLFSQ